MGGYRWLSLTGDGGTFLFVDNWLLGISVGPTLGLWLYTSVDERLPFIVAMGTALISSLL